jgi:UPF0716 protein FxsA
VRIAAALFFLIPLVEMILLIEVGSRIGVLPTIGLVMLTAICGVWLLRLEGISTLARVQDKLGRGEIPETELLEGIMLIIGGALLLTPGFATDAIGFICLLPGLRRPIARKIIQSSAFNSMNSGFSGMSAKFNRDNTTIIDGEFDTDIDQPSIQEPRSTDRGDHQ